MRIAKWVEDKETLFHLFQKTPGLEPKQNWEKARMHCSNSASQWYFLLSTYIVPCICYPKPPSWKCLPFTKGKAYSQAESCLPYSLRKTINFSLLKCFRKSLFRFLPFVCNLYSHHILGVSSVRVFSFSQLNTSSFQIRRLYLRLCNSLTKQKPAHPSVLHLLSLIFYLNCYDLMHIHTLAVKKGEDGEISSLWSTHFKRIYVAFLFLYFIIL